METMRRMPMGWESRERKAGIAAFFHASLPIALLALGANAWAQSGVAAASNSGNSAALVDAGAGLGTIEGVAMSDDGTVYEGVRVELERAGASAPVVDTTSSDGAFQFTKVPPGAFRLTLSSPGFVPRTVTGTLQAGESYDAHDVVMAMAAATSDVHVNASRAEIAQAEVNIEETQRILGIVPNYFVAYDHDAPPMSSRQKWQMSWRTVIDPVTVAATGVVAGFEQAENVLPGYGQGAQGYAKRFGSGYADTVINTYIGSAILPTVLKQDPRYFWKGTGTVSSRFWYALANTVICKGDNGKWQPNYSAIVGGLASGAISNLYYPASDVGWGVTFEGAAIGTAEGAIQNLFQEFLVKKLTPGARRRN